ncbi:MAG: rhomboid family intramembrane serine protease [Bacteroidales bacterium]|jgi:membrane associated rhomboid family serine protease|nr:rhomboid family intramembrane serine protease [Bacteroidales bacterium]
MINYQNNQLSNPFEELKRFFRQGSALSFLIIINVAVWIFIQLINVILFLYNKPDTSLTSGWILHVFALPASLPLLVSKPWTLVTYMFLHIEIWHLIFNMLWLYWFGKIFMEFLTSRQLLNVYFLGGIAGGLVYVLAFNIFPVFSPIVSASFALGASASVMAIVTAISFYVPTYTIRLLFIGQVKILYLAIILFVFDFFMIPSGNAGGHLAHIGGALCGFIYILVYKTSKASGNFRSSPSFFTNLKNKFSSKQGSYNRSSDHIRRPLSDEEYNIRKKENQKRIDEILEKISKGGYDSLTKEEKEFLFSTSGKRRSTQA